MAAASFDDVVAISGYTIFKSFGLSAGHGGLAWTIMHGPVDMITGVLAGALAGVLASATALWDSREKRSVLIFVLGMLLMFGGKYINFSGGGAMGGLCMGIVANKLWSSGWAPGGRNGRLSVGPDDHFAHDVETDLAVAWKTFFQPLLFGVIGSAIKFANLSPATIPRSILLIFIGLCIRLPAAFFACSFGALDFKEKLFIALSWMPKATVQAALASDPLETILEHKQDEANFDEWEKWGNDILTTAVFSIILTAPLGMLIINILGPRWLSKDLDPEAEANIALAVVRAEGSMDLAAPVLANGKEHAAAAAADMQKILKEATDHVQSANPGRSPTKMRTSHSSEGSQDDFNVDLSPERVRKRASFDISGMHSRPPTIPGSPGSRRPRRSVGSIEQMVSADMAPLNLNRRRVRASMNLAAPPPRFGLARSSGVTMDASEKLEILTFSLRIHIEELQAQPALTEKTTKMLGTLTALNELCRKHLENARPVRERELFDTTGAFFRIQKEEQELLESARTLTTSVGSANMDGNPV